MKQRRLEAMLHWSLRISAIAGHRFFRPETFRELADEIYQVLVKSQTSNEEFLESILSVIETSSELAAVE
jgi:hypothetical protein